MGTIVYKLVRRDRDRAQLALRVLCILETQVVGHIIKLRGSLTLVYWCFPNLPTKVSSIA